MATVASRPEVKEAAGKTPRVESTTAAISGAANAVKGMTADTAAKLPDAMATTRAAFDDANRRIQAGSDEMVVVGTAMGFGFAVGLLIGGANRLLVAMAFVPVAMMGLNLLDRSSGGREALGGLKGPGGL